MKRLFAYCLGISLLLTGCTNAPKHTCPACQSDIEEIPDPEYALEWLINTGYLERNGFFHSDDLNKKAKRLYLQDPALLIEDVLDNDSIIEYLRNKGWVIIDPEK